MDLSLPDRARVHPRMSTLASYDISGDALGRHASHQVPRFVAGWAG